VNTHVHASGAQFVATFLRPSERSMKNTRGSSGFGRLELAAEGFFDVERVLAIILSEISDRLARFITIRDHSRRRRRRLLYRPAKFDSGIHRDDPGLAVVLSDASETARERIEASNESVLIPFNAAKMQPEPHDDNPTLQRKGLQPG
jgi:hypothetical protein